MLTSLPAGAAGAGVGERARIRLAYGGGGLLTRRLVRHVFRRHLGNPVLDRLEDAALLPLLWDGAQVPDGGGNRSAASPLAVTTDAFVVSPPFFPGGAFGRLSVCGTVNDLAVMAARPQALTASFILEEGLPLEGLERAVASMAAAAERPASWGG